MVSGDQIVLNFMFQAFPSVTGGPDQSIRKNTNGDWCHLRVPQLSIRQMLNLIGDRKNCSFIILLPDFSSKKFVPSNTAMNSFGVIVQYLVNFFYVFQNRVCVSSGKVIYNAAFSLIGFTTGRVSNVSPMRSVRMSKFSAI